MEEKPKIAVALRYDDARDEAPRIAAKGTGDLADRIVDIAEQHGIAIRRNDDLVQILQSLEMDAPIPVAAFAAVAEILAHLYRTNDRLREAKS